MVDIRVVPPPSGPICDFCSERPVTARYHAETFEMKSNLVETPFHQMSMGDWAACSDCEKLIDAYDWEGVVARAVTAFFRNHPELELTARMTGMTQREFRKMMKEDFWSLYRQLRQNKFSKSSL